MKKSIKKILISLCACIVLTSTLAGCAVMPMKKTTLQEVYDASPDIQKSFDDDIKEFKRTNSDAYSDAQIDITGNQISYIFTFKETMPATYKNLFLAALGNSLTIQCQTQVNSLRKNATYLTSDPVSMRYVFLNPDGSEFYSYTYTEPQN